jgi:hypothetical protein
MESYEQCGQGQSYCSLCTSDTIHSICFATRLIIDKINKVQWVDFKLENLISKLFFSIKYRGLVTHEWNDIKKSFTNSPYIDIIQI